MCFVLKFALPPFSPPLPSVVQFPKHNMERTFVINTYIPSSNGDELNEIYRLGHQMALLVLLTIFTSIPSCKHNDFQVITTFAATETGPSFLEWSERCVMKFPV